MATLDQVPTGRRCRVDGLDGPPALVQRLSELGIMDGEPLVVLARAPLGDPIEIESSLTRLSLRAAEAARVRVSLTD
jgi:ferrous iron transport protein A